jgi:hypothetical protein
MKNPITNSVPKLVTQLGDIYPGVLKYTVALGFRPTLADETNTMLTGLVTATTTHKAAKGVLRTRRTAAKSVLQTAMTFSTLVREHLKPALGKRYTAAWDEVGFRGTLEIPYSIDPMIVFLLNLAAFLTSHPEFENAEANLTAARALALKENLATTKNGIVEQKAVVQRALEARNDKSVDAKEFVREFFNDLTFDLEDMDSRWPEFGFNKPGQKETPPAPLNIVAVLIGPNAVALKWDAAPRAEYYRVWKKVVGVDTGFVFVESRADLDFALEGLPSGAQVEIAISAVNAGGESAKSEVVKITTP